jgi:hypothetical protein
MNRWSAIALILLAAGCRSLHIATGSGPDEPAGVVRLRDRARSSRVDLRPDIAGCQGDVFDPATEVRLGRQVRVRVLDATRRDGRDYILLIATAPPNCNIQGACGASPRPDATLVWLEIAPDLSVLRRQMFVVDHCVGARYVRAEADDWAARVRLTNDVLAIKFDEIGRGLDGGDITGRADYDRRAPAAGIRITRLPGAAR